MYLKFDVPVVINITNGSEQLVKLENATDNLVLDEHEKNFHCYDKLANQHKNNISKEEFQQKFSENFDSIFSMKIKDLFSMRIKDIFSDDFKNSVKKLSEELSENSNNETAIMTIVIPEDEELHIDSNNVTLISDNDLTINSLTLDSNKINLIVKDLHISERSNIDTNKINMKTNKLTLNSALKIKSNKVDMEIVKDVAKPVNVSYKGNKIDADIAPNQNVTVGELNINSNKGNIICR